MKIAIVADSNSGVTQDEVKKLGIYVLPMPFMIDGQVFYEGIDLSHEEFYRRMEEGADITTSQPSPKDVMEQWEQLLEDHGGVHSHVQRTQRFLPDSPYAGKRV